MAQFDGEFSQYSYAWKLSRSHWAWEFLRRNPEFLKDAARHGSEGYCQKNLA